MMEKIYDIKPKHVNTIPKELDPGVLYICKNFEIAAHLCACGCGVKAITPIREGEWSLTENKDKISLSPSIGNWSGQNPYHAHYFIRNNKIDWC